MRFPLVAITLASLLCCASRATALGRGELLLQVDGGAGFGVVNQRYAQMQHTSGTLGVGASLRIKPGLRARLEANYFYFWRSQPDVATAEHVRWDPSHVSMALAGIELVSPAPSQAAPFTAVEVGVAQVAIGDAHGTALNGLPFTTPGDRLTRPAISVLAGVRTRPVGKRGPSLLVQLGYVFIAVPGNHAAIVPLTLGAAF